MHVLLVDVLGVEKSVVCLRVPFFDRDMERVLVELYYRGVADGLVHKVIADESFEFLGDVVDIMDWVNDKLSTRSVGKEKSLLESILMKFVTA